LHLKLLHQSLFLYRLIRNCSFLLLQQILSFYLSLFSIAAASSFFLLCCSMVTWLLCKEKINSSQFADFEKLLNSNFSAIQNSQIHGFKDCQLGVFSELSTVNNLTLQGQNLSCQLSVLDKSDNWSKLSFNSESGSYKLSRSIVPCQFHFPYACSIKLGVDNSIKIQVLSWMYLLYACCIKLGVYNFIKNRVPSCMYVLYACCIKLGVYNFIEFFQSPTCCSSYIRLKKLESSTQESSSMGKQLHQLTVNNNTYSTSKQLWLKQTQLLKFA
jgi:hypothetical protein